jgi:xylulose-5-phosphate/fructose-6-phosphate phosphoketolase
MSREENENLYKSYGLVPIIVGADHNKIAEAFNTAFTQLKKSKNALQPIIILETPKGWSSPVRFGKKMFGGSVYSHKPILKNPAYDVNELEMIKKWLMSYKPDELFDSEGSPVPNVTNCLPVSENLLGQSHQIDQTSPILIQNPDLCPNSPIKAISLNLLNGIKNSTDIIIFSPDELISNGFDDLLEVTKLKYSKTHNAKYSANGQVIEILNEQLCYAWSQGYSMAGHHAVIISYEAFAQLFDSMTAQHLKFLKVSESVEWRPSCPSVNIILTSLGWNNSPSHHNPGFVDNLIGRNLKNVKICMPITTTTASSFFKEMIESNNRINIMVISKHELKKISAIAIEANNRKCTSWLELQSDTMGEPKISLIAIGDCMAEECLYAKEIINSRYPDYFVRVLAIEDISLFERSKHSDLENFRLKIADSSSCVWVYNGYTKTIKGLLWDLGITSNTNILGFKDYDQSEGGIDRFFKNDASRFNIANEAIRLLFPQNMLLCEKLKLNILRGS